MSQETASNGAATQLPQDLTPQEKEVISLLLKGKSPNEIAYFLKISYDTVLALQKTLFLKIDVQSLQEIFSKYLIDQTDDKNDSEKENTINFLRWFTLEDKEGSFISITKTIEFIQGRSQKSFVIAGNLVTGYDAYSGVHALPDLYTLDAMKKMSSFSFTVLGDGNTYGIMIPTSDSKLNGGMNHYYKDFSTEKGIITTIEININELAQSPYFGTPVAFDKNNIEFFQLNARSAGIFNLKFWDIKFF